MFNFWRKKSIRTKVYNFKAFGFQIKRNLRLTLQHNMRRATTECTLYKLFFSKSTLHFHIFSFKSQPTAKCAKLTVNYWLSYLTSKQTTRWNSNCASRLSARVRHEFWSGICRCQEPIRYTKQSRRYFVELTLMSRVQHPKLSAQRVPRTCVVLLEVGAKATGRRKFRERVEAKFSYWGELWLV